jgi:glycosyltransferase involved in cell wall biosynthesis
MKRILYALEDYPISSETYVQTEIDYFLRQGIEIAAWSRREDSSRSPSSVPVFSGPLRLAIKSFKPDAIHVHWLPIVPNVLVEGLGLPVTVRGHSFDFNPTIARSYAFHPAISAVFLFPHLADATFRGTDQGKAVQLVAAYDERLFYPDPKEKSTVVRATASLRGKDIDSFLDVAALCPEVKFTLFASRPKEDTAYLVNLLGRNASMGSPVDIQVEVPQAQVAAMVRKSEICLRSNNPTGHPFGMPVSIAEAMGAGTIPVVRDHAPARGYVGDAGLYFNSTEEAASRIREILADPELSGRLRTASIERARRHASSVVLPTIFQVWERVCRW